MTTTITANQLVEAARELGQDEFTRGDMAEKLGVEKPDLKPAFVQARKAGKVEKVRDDEENTGHFRLREENYEVPAVTDAERAVADLLPIAPNGELTAAAIAAVPLWFHTFAIGDSYTPGVARDHRYRVPFLPESLEGKRVLDVGTFDGFYSFLAEARGATRVVAVDNEQYVDWVRARWEIELEGGEGFRAISALLNSKVEYKRLDAFDLAEVAEPFDLVICFGILHRVENPAGLLRIIADRLEPGGELLLESYGVGSSESSAGIKVRRSGDVYARDDFVYWGFTEDALVGLAENAGFHSVEVLDDPVIDGHPRILARLTAAA
jgi:tRNA (mo5U34)-methyltransferase